jgi:hypothetical protein
MLRDSYSDEKNGRKSMKPIIVIVMCLLVCSPAFGRQHKHSLQTIKELHTALNLLKTDGSDGTGTGEGNDNDSENDTEDTDTDATTDTDDQDTSDTKNNDDNETDDSDDDASSVKAAIRNSLRASAMKNSQEPLAAAAAALNAGLNAKQTIAQLLEPSGSLDSVTANAEVGQSLIAGLGSFATTTDASASGAVANASGSLTAGRLLSADVPEPIALSLLTMTALILFWHRRRR